MKMAKTLFLVYIFLIDMPRRINAKSPVTVNETVTETQNNGTLAGDFVEEDPTQKEKDWVVLLKGVKYLDSRDRAQQMEIQTLQSQLKIQEERTTKLEEKLADILNVLLRENTNDEKRKDNAVNKLEQMKAEFQHAEKGYHRRVRRTDSDLPISFFATLSKHIEHAGMRQPIVFDNITTNIGNAYNGHMGSFVAPVSGVYVFSTTLFSVNKMSFHASFVINGHVLTNFYIAGSESVWDTSSQTIVLHLQRGDNVCVQNNDSDRSIHGHSYSIFSGYLMKEYYSNTDSNTNCNTA